MTQHTNPEPIVVLDTGDHDFVEMDRILARFIRETGSLDHSLDGALWVNVTADDLDELEHSSYDGETDDVWTRLVENAMLVDAQERCWVFDLNADNGALRLVLDKPDLA